jgi:hypothetical protein
MKAELAIPDYSIISKRSINLPKHVLDKQPAARIMIGVWGAYSTVIRPPIPR